MNSRRRELGEFTGEVAAALAIGLGVSIVCPAASFSRICDPLIASISIILASVIPALTLTAAAQRPPMDSAVEAQRLGLKLEEQVRFWFAFFITGALPIGALLIGKALDWQLSTPRPSFIPVWVPPGNAWLVFLSSCFVSFAVIRVRHVSTAVIGLVRLGTQASKSQALDRRRQIQTEVEDALKAIPVDKDRGKHATPKEREPRASN